MKKRTSLTAPWIAFLCLFLIASSSGVTVHFEHKDGGFFLRQYPTRGSGSSQSEGSPGSGAPLSLDRFTVFQSSQPISVRASYGPFSTKQTVPARYVVPDPLPLNTTGPGYELQDLALTHHLDMSAHLVRPEVPRDSPTLRVLFHTGGDPATRRPPLLPPHRRRPCIVLHASLPPHAPLLAACSPDGEDGVCLAQVTVPAHWWPSLRPTPPKQPPRVVQVAYGVLEADAVNGCKARAQVQPATILAAVPLVPARAAYKEVRLGGGALVMLVPHPPLFPLSRMHVPVFVEKEKAKLLTAIVLRSRVKSGIRILDATSSGAGAWNMTVDINPRHTTGTVTLIRKEPPDSEVVSSDGDVLELFSWLLEVSEDASELYEGAKVVWSTRFEPHQEEQENSETHRPESRKSTTRFDIQKDDIQAVVPISKNWEVLNTAVLTGRQVSQAMKVFIVSQAGKAADVTFQASCHSEDDSVLKVSSSCSSVYVDGSEARGSVNGSVLVKYGTYTGLARFTVWMPEFPLDLQVPDTKLSQLKSWKVPDYLPSTIGKTTRKRRSYSWTGEESPSPQQCRLRYQQSPVDVYAHFLASDHESGRISYLVNRRTWLRVTDLVLPLLRVSDPRIASLHGRVLQGRSMGRTEVQVLSPITGRVIGAKEIRVTNDKVGISRLQVQVVSGLQLNISPDSSIENGYVAETSVTRKLTAQYQEGLLDIDLEFSDSSVTPLREIADSDYHLSVESLDPEVVAFAPMAASHHPRVIAVGEGGGDLLRVTLQLAEECRGGRTRAKGAAAALASAMAAVSVDFSAAAGIEVGGRERPDILQNDGGSYAGSKSRDFQDLRDIIKGNPLFKEDKSQEPNVQARQYQGKGISRHHVSAHMTPLEISMYVLLAAFCCAIVVFVVSCVVYASKFKPTEGGIAPGSHAHPLSSTSEIPSHMRRPSSQRSVAKALRSRRETVANAHDWVWLGRATVDSSGNRSSALMNNNNPQPAAETAPRPGDVMRITANPLSMNYCDPDDCLNGPSSFAAADNAPTKDFNSNRSAGSVVVDSSTYCKGRSGDKRTLNAGPGGEDDDDDDDDDLQIWNRPTPPPPLPPHAAPLSPPARSLPLEAEDYRPPVPPHRNITSSLTGSSGAGDATPPRKPQHQHHRHQHHYPKRVTTGKGSQESYPLLGQEGQHQPAMEQESHHYLTGEESSPLLEDDVRPEPLGEAEPPVSMHYRDDLLGDEGAFEFDDEPNQEERMEEENKGDEMVVRLRDKQIKNDNDDEMQFVQYPKSPNSNNRLSAEVKRATIVGNPMFSADDNQTDSVPPSDAQNLEDLQLDMDYDQIMHYFENLKESNA